MADRAKKQQQSKVLRIGIVQGGKVVHERLIKLGQSVSIGESPKNTFVFPLPNLPKRYTLFQARGDRYFLNFTPKMKGKIDYRGAVTPLDVLRQRGDAIRRGNVASLPLDDKNRGRLDIDGITVLFQFVPAPPESARMVGRRDFRPRLLDEDDPVFLGFLALFTAIATVMMVYVYNTEPIEAVSLDQIPDRFTHIVMAKPEQKEKPPEPMKNERQVSQQIEKTKPKEKPKTEPKPKTEREKRQAAAALRERKRQEVMKKSALLKILSIGTTGENNSGQQVVDAFGSSTAQFSSLDKAMQGVTGVDVQGGADFEVKRQTDAGGREDASIGDLAGAGGGTARVGSGPRVQVPSGRSRLLKPELPTGKDADLIRKTLRRYAGQIQYCYEWRLKSNPNIAGRIEVALDIAAGRVRNVRITDNETGDKPIEDCMVRKVQRWHFPSSVTQSDIYLPFALTAG